MSKSNGILAGIIEHVDKAADVNVLVATNPKRDDPIELHRLGMTTEVAQEFRDAAYNALPDDEDDGDPRPLRGYLQAPIP